MLNKLQIICTLKLFLDFVPVGGKTWKEKKVIIGLVLYAKGVTCTQDFVLV